MPYISTKISTNKYMIISIKYFTKWLAYRKKITVFLLVSEYFYLYLQRFLEIKAIK
jgi:hypothetical protein